MDAAGFLASRVLHEKQPVTYRLLSRHLGVHVNQAKQELFAFASKNQEQCHALYLVAGFKKPQQGHQTQENDQDADMQTVEQLGSEEVPCQLFELVPAHELEDRKASFDRITSIHIYSLQPGPLKPAGYALLATINNALHTDPKLVKAWKDSNNGAKFGVIQTQGRKAIPKTTITAPPSKPTSFAKDSTLNASTKRKAEQDEFKKLSASSKLKPADSKKGKSKSPQPSTSTSKQPSKKSNASSSKAPSDEDMDADEDENAVMRAEQQRAELEAMMDDDDQEIAKLAKKTDTKTKAKEKEKDKPKTASKPKQELAEPKAPKQPKDKKRIKKTRKVIKVTKDEKGYKKREEVEEEYTATESDSDNEPSSKKSKAKKPSTGDSKKASSSSKNDKKEEKPKKKSVGKPGEQTSMKSFFKKT